MRTVFLSFLFFLAASGSGSLTAGQNQWIQLFNGRDLSGWDVKISGHPLNENYNNTFRVRDGILQVCSTITSSSTVSSGTFSTGRSSPTTSSGWSTGS